jgi:predicted DNA-binding transcriptional regulator AlpA
VLLTSAQAAREVFGVSERKFHQLREKPWMPRPVVLGPRLVRWHRHELEAAALNIPREQTPSEPAQLRRARIEAIKRGQAAA